MAKILLLNIKLNFKNYFQKSNVFFYLIKISKKYAKNWDHRNFEVSFKKILKTSVVMKLTKIEWIKGFWRNITPFNKIKINGFFKVNLLKCLHWYEIWKNLFMTFVIILYWMLMFRIVKKLLHVMHMIRDMITSKKICFTHRRM